MYESYFKRIIDVLVAAGLLLVLLIPLLVVAACIKIDSDGPLFFRQTRLGKNLKTFDVYKFRTMTHEQRSVENIIGKTVGVTGVGYYLRKFKIDELPQLLNVLFGQMSLVGPRPSVPEQLSKMSAEETKRYDVCPGLTGLAQVSGNIHLSWTERYVLDLLYVRNITFYNDMLILCRTALLVVKGEEKFVNKTLKIKQLK
ncbi:MAG TPA: sugar transferase [Flavobacterium sp.]|jgi:lipopolysaccharide/colanic/teichoic acid biosynthesis glycosyltransferase